MTVGYGQPGELLFHYTSAATAFEHILPSGKIRLSPYSAMRDPLEAKDWPEPSAFWVDDSDPQQDQRHLARMGIVFQAKRAARLLCLTEDADDCGEGLEPFGRGYGRASMWQFYGGDHRGVCLAFDRDALIATLADQLDDSARIMHKRVRYVRGLELDALPPVLDGDSRQWRSTRPSTATWTRTQISCCSASCSIGPARRVPLRSGPSRRP